MYEEVVVAFGCLNNRGIAALLLLWMLLLLLLLLLLPPLLLLLLPAATAAAASCYCCCWCDAVGAVQCHQICCSSPAGANVGALMTQPTTATLTAAPVLRSCCRFPPIRLHLLGAALVCAMTAGCHWHAPKLTGRVELPWHHYDHVLLQ